MSSVSAMVTSNLAISNRPHQNISRRTSQKVTTLHGICSNIKKVIQVQSRRGPNPPLPRPGLVNVNDTVLEIPFEWTPCSQRSNPVFEKLLNSPRKNPWVNFVRPIGRFRRNSPTRSNSLLSGYGTRLNVQGSLGGDVEDSNWPARTAAANNSYNKTFSTFIFLSLRVRMAPEEAR